MNGKPIYVTTTNGEVADRVGNAFHAITGYAHTSRKDDKLFLVSTTPTDNVRGETLRRVAKEVIREEDIAIIF